MVAQNIVENRSSEQTANFMQLLDRRERTRPSGASFAANANSRLARYPRTRARLMSSSLGERIDSRLTIAKLAAAKDRVQNTESKKQKKTDHDREASRINFISHQYKRFSEAVQFFERSIKAMKLTKEAAPILEALKSTWRFFDENPVENYGAYDVVSCYNFSGKETAIADLILNHLSELFDSDPCAARRIWTSLELASKFDMRFEWFTGRVAAASRREVAETITNYRVQHDQLAALDSADLTGFQREFLDLVNQRRRAMIKSQDANVEVYIGLGLLKQAIVNNDNSHLKRHDLHPELRLAIDYLKNDAEIIKLYHQGSYTASQMLEFLS
ncbi:MAG: hypothetical protein OXU45_03350 [Candidatus Melainabacteria bacterium]|nr:hypothetical protein [Candidatus Melainabacteria bacterium]